MCVDRWIGLWTWVCLWINSRTASIIINALSLVVGFDGCMPTNERNDFPDCCCAMPPNFFSSLLDVRLGQAYSNQYVQGNSNKRYMYSYNVNYRGGSGEVSSHVYWGIRYTGV